MRKGGKATIKKKGTEDCTKDLKYPVDVRVDMMSASPSSLIHHSPDINPVTDKRDLSRQVLVLAFEKKAATSSVLNETQLLCSCCWELVGHLNSNVWVGYRFPRKAGPRS